MLRIPLTLEYMCPTGYEKSPFLSKADVSKKYRTIECGITREMLLIKSQILSLPCLDLQEIQSLRETVPTPYREFKILFPVSLGPGFIVGKKAKNGVKQRKKKRWTPAFLSQDSRSARRFFRLFHSLRSPGYPRSAGLYLTRSPSWTHHGLLM